MSRQNGIFRIHKNYKRGSLSAIRLFQVKAEGHCVQYSGDWWVTNKLTVIKEVTKEDIYSYFMNNSFIKAKVMKHLKLNHDFGTVFLNQKSLHLSNRKRI